MRILLALPVAIGCSVALADEKVLELADSRFELRLDPETGGVLSLRSRADARVNHVIGAADQPRLAVRDSRWLGDLVLRYRLGNAAWQLGTTGLSADSRRIAHERTSGRIDIHYAGDSREAGGIVGLAVSETWRLAGEALVWSIRIRNQTQEYVELGDLGLPLPFNTAYAKETRTTYEERFVRHSYIAGDNSFVMLVRASGAGPHLLMTPAAGTRLEYFDRCVEGGRANADPSVFGTYSGNDTTWEGLYTAYVHASVQAREIEPRGSWNHRLTSRVLEPAGRSGDTIAYSFRFRWVADYSAARRALIEEGLLDVQTAPGMVIPSNLGAMVSIGARQQIESVTAQYPQHTSIEPAASPDPKRRNWRFTFRRLGENNIRIRWAGGRDTELEYFVTEPLEVLIHKRAAFIARQQQVRDPRKWYDGLFSLWDMKEGRLRTPDDPDGLQPYLVGGSDDPDLSKAPYIASKNVIYPDAREVEAVEYYLEHFVWGKLQRTDRERPFPYGIYGSDNWHENRNSPIGYGSGGLGQEHMWRTFDYTHLVQLYYQMYRIARLYPDLVHYLSAAGYLDRAYGTAMAFFEVPYQIKMGPPFAFRGWTDWAYKQGAFHELYITPLIDTLIREGRTSEAAKLRLEWEKKVKYFAYDDRYPFASEMYFDTTAFQSAHFLARYGLERELKPDGALWRDKNSGVVYSHPEIRRTDFVRLMDRSIAANIAARGRLESNYYQLGSDYRQHGNSSYLLSYMTQMGGAPILDYALNFAQADTSGLMRLGYASYLGSWALVNSGTRESSYGYWYEGPQNDGAASWAFMPEKYGPVFAGETLDQGRGGWRYDGEIDNGFSDALLDASTVVTEDPLFGLIALGGEVERTANALRIQPKDGVGQRIHVRTARQRLDLTLDRDGFDPRSPVSIGLDSDRLEFVLSSRYAKPHETGLKVTGLAAGRYRLVFAEGTRELTTDARSGALTGSLPVGTAPAAFVLQRIH